MCGNSFEPMKTYRMVPTKLISALAILGIAVIADSCKSSKVKSASTERKIEVLCSGDKYFSNNKFFRANAIGESMDQMTAKKKSMSNARAELASKVNTTVTAVIDNYIFVLLRLFVCGVWLWNARARAPASS